MTTPITLGSAAQRTWPRSLAALFYGFIAVVALSLGTDELFHLLKVYPPWQEPMYAPGQNALALSYRILYGILGSYITARFAPNRPMAHSLISGAVGTVLSVGGIIVALTKHLGPAWYPIAITATALPCAWLGGVIHRRMHPERAN
jgi:hypothetical protein